MVHLQRTVVLWRILPNESPALWARQGIAARLSAVSTTGASRPIRYRNGASVQTAGHIGMPARDCAQGTLRHRVMVRDDQRFVPTWRHTPHLEVLCPTDADEPETRENIDHFLT